MIIEYKELGGSVGTSLQPKRLPRKMKKALQTFHRTGKRTKHMRGYHFVIFNELNS